MGMGRRNVSVENIYQYEIIDQHESCGSKNDHYAFLNFILMVATTEQGRFLDNGGCGYILRPDYMFSDSYHPADPSTLAGQTQYTRPSTQYGLMVGLQRISGRPDIRPFFISCFACRISGWPDSRVSGQKKLFMVYPFFKTQVSTKYYSRISKTVKVIAKMSTGCLFCDTL